MSKDIINKYAESHFIEVQLLDEVFQFDVADIDIEAYLKLQEAVVKLPNMPFSLELVKEIQEICIAFFGVELFNKAMQGKNKSIRNTTLITIALSKVFEEVEKLYGKPNTRTTKKR